MPNTLKKIWPAIPAICSLYTCAIGCKHPDVQELEAICDEMQKLTLSNDCSEVAKKLQPINDKMAILTKSKARANEQKLDELTNRFADSLIELFENCNENDDFMQAFTSIMRTLGAEPPTTTH
jgi:hypothetical protein